MSLTKFVAIAAILLAVAALSATPSLAAKGGKPGTASSTGSSIVLNYPATTESADVSWPRLGDSVSFSTVATGLAGWEYPMVAIWCYQDGVLVYMELATPDSAFILGGGSSDWRLNGGAANCEAYLYAYGKGPHESIRTLAGTTFLAAE